MGRLKKEHSGYKTSGLWAKYQPEKENRSKRLKRRDTRRWCKGKVGIEHTWHSYQDSRWSDSEWDYVKDYINTECIVCGKKNYAKKDKIKNYPLHAFIQMKSEGYEPIQVKVNGNYLPIDYLQYREGKCWCNYCGYWH